jgi:hypothetical protein
MKFDALPFLHDGPAMGTVHSISPPESWP